MLNNDLSVREVNHAFAAIASLESAHGLLVGLMDDVNHQRNTDSYTDRLRIIQAMVPGMDVSIENEEGSPEKAGFAEKAKRIAIMIAKAIRQFITVIYEFLTGTRNTIRLRRKKIRLGLEGLKNDFSELRSKKGRMTMRREFIRNVFIVQRLSIGGKLQPSNVLTAIGQLTNMLRDVSNLTTKTLNDQRDIVSTIGTLRSDVEQVKLLKPLPQLSFCSMSLTPKDAEVVNLEPYNIGFKSREISGNYQVTYVGFKSGARQRDTGTKVSNTDLPIIPWWENNHGYFFTRNEEGPNLDTIANRGFLIMSDTEIDNTLVAVDEFLVTIGGLETDIDILQRALKRIDREVAKLTGSEYIGSDVGRGLRPYLMGAIQNSIDIYTALLNHSLGVSQQSLSWANASLKVYSRN